MNARHGLMLLAMLLALGGCAGDSNVNRDSPDYAAGYSDGCATGQARDTYPRGRVTRDEEAFRHNADYKAGWRTGYNACAVHQPGSLDGPLGR